MLVWVTYGFSPCFGFRALTRIIHGVLMNPSVSGESIPSFWFWLTDQKLIQPTRSYGRVLWERNKNISNKPPCFQPVWISICFISSVTDYAAHRDVMRIAYLKFIINDTPKSSYSNSAAATIPDNTTRTFFKQTCQKHDPDWCLF